MWIIDVESRSHAKLEDCGSRVYCEDETTLLTAISWGRYPVKELHEVESWSPWAGFSQLYRQTEQYPNVCLFEPPPEPLLNILKSSEPLGAYNSQFESDFFEFVMTRFGWPRIHPDRWVDLMAHAQYYGLPGKLEQAIDVARAPVPKGDNRAMLKLCKPRPHWVRTGKGNPWFCTEELLEELIQYNKIDVLSESKLAEICPVLPSDERKIWRLTRDMNAEGLPIDVRLAKAGADEHKRRVADAATRLPLITGIPGLKPTQVAKIKGWLGEQGFPLASLNKKEIQPWLDAQEFPSNVQEVLEIRLSAGTAATAKYQAFCDRLALDGRVHGELRYAGAHTLRWSSLGVQTQNLSGAKMDIDVAESLIPGFISGNFEGDNLDAFLSTVVRSTICAPEGWEILDTDFTAVEARAIAWMARDDALLRDFSSGFDIYKSFAARVYHIPYDEVTSAQRKFGKVAILGLGYGMGWKRFQQTCIDWGAGDPGEALARSTVALYREMYPKVPRFWYGLETAIRNEMEKGTGSSWDRYSFYYDKKTRILRAYMPIGTPLTYHRCGFDDENQITYWGRDAKQNNRWNWVRSWGGKFAENFDQRMCRDLMAQAMLRIREKFPFFRLFLTVHDEVAGMAPKDLIEQYREEIETEARKVPLWATGMPIDLGSFVSRRFRKD